MNYYTDVIKKYAVFNGRATRKEFWMFTLWNVIILIALMIIVNLIASATDVNSFRFIYWLYALAIILPTLGLSIRRLHDTDRSGWWLLIDLVPIVGPIVLLVFYIQDSKPDNQYGPNPKGTVNAPGPVAGTQN